MSNETWLRDALAARLKARRLDGQFSQEQVAAAARDVGIDWYRETVAAIENGKRAISVEELLLLPLAFGRLQGDIGPAFELAELLPEQGFLRLTRQASISVSAASAAVTGTATAPDRKPFADFDVPIHARMKAGINEAFEHWAVIDDHWRADHGEGMTPRILREIRQAAAGEAERKAATKLGVTPYQVSLASFFLHKQSLTSARDKMVAARLDAAPPAVHGGPQLVRDGAEILPRTIQALRGHMTRVLVDQIENALNGRLSWIREVEEL